MDESPGKNDVQKAIDRALVVVNRLAPRDVDQIDTQRELSARLFTVMMEQSKGEIDAPAALEQIEEVRLQALAHLKGVMSPGTHVLLLQDCVEQHDGEFVTDGPLSFTLGEYDWLEVPHRTPIRIRTLAAGLRIIVTLPGGVELRLSRETYPLDGIPVQKISER